MQPPMAQIQREPDAIRRDGERRRRRTVEQHRREHEDFRHRYGDRPTGHTDHEPSARNHEAGEHDEIDVEPRVPNRDGAVHQDRRARDHHCGHEQPQEQWLRRLAVASFTVVHWNFDLDQFTRRSRSARQSDPRIDHIT